MATVTGPMYFQLETCYRTGCPNCPDAWVLVLAHKIWSCLRSLLARARCTALLEFSQDLILDWSRCITGVLPRFCLHKTWYKNAADEFNKTLLAPKASFHLGDRFRPWDLLDAHACARAFETQEILGRRAALRVFVLPCLQSIKTAMLLGSLTVTEKDTTHKHTQSHPSLSYSQLFPPPHTSISSHASTR